MREDGKCEKGRCVKTMEETYAYRELICAYFEKDVSKKLVKICFRCRNWRGGNCRKVKAEAIEFIKVGCPYFEPGDSPDPSGFGNGTGPQDESEEPVSRPGDRQVPLACADVFCDFQARAEGWMRLYGELLWLPRKDEGVVRVLFLDRTTGEGRNEFFSVEEFFNRLSYLKGRNADGLEVYASPNLLNPEARKVRKASAKYYLPMQRVVYLDFDSKAHSAQLMVLELYRLVQTGLVPEPSLIVKSSTGNYQIYWVFDGDIAFERLQKVMEGLESWFSLDKTHDITRVLRIPGLRNHKRGEPVTIPTDYRLAVDSEKGEYLRFSLQPLPVFEFDRMESDWAGNERGFLEVDDFFVWLRGRVYQEGLRRVEEGRRYGKDRHFSESEVDFWLSLRAVKLGISRERVETFLETFRQDKPKPGYYASLTVKKALTSLNSPPPGD